MAREQRRTELIKQALGAREFYENGKQYVLSEDRVLIIDEFTGRPMPAALVAPGNPPGDRSQEKLPLTDPTETIARMSFQRYFRLYRLSGMTGTAREARRVVADLSLAGGHYSDEQTVRSQRNLRIAFSPPRGQMAGHCRGSMRHSSDRPSAFDRDAQRFGQRTTRGEPHGRSVTFRLLNAVRHQEEAQIIAEAGSKGRITIATNMAGRGTDIKLEPGVAALGGLHVIATERHESKRVDRQLFGRAARQGDPGSAQAFVSAEDELLRRFLPKAARTLLLRRLLQTPQRPQIFAKAAIAWAQHTSQREAFRRRREVLRMDDWLGETLSFAGSEIEAR